MVQASHFVFNDKNRATPEDPTAIVKFYILRSKLRYWIASAMCDASIFSEPVKSAIVRPTFSTRLYALALKPSLLIAVSNNLSASSFTEQ